MADCMQCRKCGSSGTTVSEKTPQFLLPSLPGEYVAEFSGRTEAPEVRCDLTDRHTHTQTDRQTDRHRHGNYRNPRCACAPRVNEKHYSAKPSAHYCWQSYSILAYSHCKLVTVSRAARTQEGRVG